MTTLSVERRTLLGVSEIFGPTLQGEGPSTGRRCAFLRLAGCNLACAWCDTPYTWDWSQFDARAEILPLAPEDVIARIRALGVGMLVVTGGEPVRQQDRLGPVLAAMKRDGIRVEVETNGTLTAPDILPWVDQFNVSPKLAHSGMALERRYRPDALRWLVRSGKAIFKFVARDPADLGEIAAIAEGAEIPPRLIYVMPEGTTVASQVAGLPRLADAVIERGWNLTPRLHTLCWGDERGR